MEYEMISGLWQTTYSKKTDSSGISTVYLGWKYANMSNIYLHAVHFHPNMQQ